MPLYHVRLSVAGRPFGIHALGAEGFDGMLLGMDVICKGRLSVGGGEFEFSMAGQMEA